MKLTRFRFRLRRRPNLRRLVFWGSLFVMLGAALTGLFWAVIEREFGPGPLTMVTVGLGALLIALAFGLLEFTNPTFHPESHLFDWSDVDSLRTVSRQTDLDAETRDWARSLAERIAVVLPGRAPSDRERRHSRTKV
jgi:hypothetical protein